MPTCTRRIIASGVLATASEMSTEVKKEIELEIAHVLFSDIVGYSKLLINEQRGIRDTLPRRSSATRRDLRWRTPMED